MLLANIIEAAFSMNFLILCLNPSCSTIICWNSNAAPGYDEDLITRDSLFEGLSTRKIPRTPSKLYGKIPKISQNFEKL